MNHLEFNASDKAVIVSAADKIHNLLSMLVDYETVGEDYGNVLVPKVAPTRCGGINLY